MKYFLALTFLIACSSCSKSISEETLIRLEDKENGVVCYTATRKLDIYCFQRNKVEVVPIENTYDR